MAERRYSSIWKELKKKGEVKIRCKAVKMRTLVQAVKKEKARENAPRIGLDLPSFGKMDITRTVNGEMAEVFFKLKIIARAEDL